MAAADIVTGSPAVALAGTAAATRTGGTGSKAANWIDETPPARRCQTASPLPSPSRATSGESRMTPGVEGATGSATPNSPRRAATRRRSRCRRCSRRRTRSGRRARRRPPRRRSSSVAPDSGRAAVNAPRPERTADTIVSADSQVAAVSPASSRANVGLIRRAPGAESLTGADHGPAGGRSATATWEGLPVSVKSHIAVSRPSGVAAISALQFELPGPPERGSDAANAGASAAFNAVSTWKSPSVARAPRPDRRDVARRVDRHARRAAQARACVR